MAAQASIADVLSALDPNRPLEGEALTSLYVGRQPPVHRRLAQLLQPAGAKVALWGQSGSGKSTEISKLQLEREGHERYVVVSPGVRHDLSRIGLNELAQEAAYCSVRAGLQHKVNLSGSLNRRLGKIGISFDGRVDYAIDPIAVASDPPAFVLQEAAAAMREVESGLGKPLVLLFDGLEKLSAQHAAAVLGPNGEALAMWPVRALFVVPPLLVYAPEWADIGQYIKDTVFLPALALDDSVAGFGARQFFEYLANRRLSLVSMQVDPTLLEMAIRNSGGLPRQFIQILREAFIESSLDDLDTPDRDCMDRALGRIRNGFLLKLRPEHVERLKSVHLSRPDIVSAEDHDLIAMGCIIQYQAGTNLWHDVNPVLLAA